MGELVVWDLLLRGGVLSLLLFHALNLLGRGAGLASRVALLLFTLSLMAYIPCQHPGLLMRLPGWIATLLLALCSSATAWLWLSACAVFEDPFRWSWRRVLLAGSMAALGLAASLPRLEALRKSDQIGMQANFLANVHAASMLIFAVAAVWVVIRGWHDDLVEPRRRARRWVALGLTVYAAVALVVELKVRDSAIDPVLPALHVAGIGLVSLALALLLARHPLHMALGFELSTGCVRRAADTTRQQGNPQALARPASPAAQKLDRAMAESFLYRQEGLTIAKLAALLGVGEPALRTAINQELGYRNFNDFLHHHRLQEATSRLATSDLPILTIALECGYGSIGPFNRAFRQRFGMTPTDYRARARVGSQHAPS